MDSLSPEKIAEIKELIKDLDFNPVNQSLIKDNKLIFIFNSKPFRCRMPNQKIQSDAEAEQNRNRIAMYKSDDTITKKQLIKVLKEKQGVDIAELEAKKLVIQNELNDVYIDLATTTSEEKDRIEKLRKKKEEVESKFMEITLEIVEWLSPSIEEQCKLSFYGYLAYSCTEKNVDNKEDSWEPVWKNFQEYQNDETGLSLVSLQKIQSLILYLQE